MTDVPVAQFITHSSKPAGAELFLADLAATLTEYRPIILTTSRGELKGLCDDLGVTIHEVLPVFDRGALTRSSSVWRSLAGVISISINALQVRRHSASNPAVVIAWSSKSLISGYLIAKSKNIPLVWSVHDRISPDYMGAYRAKLVGLLGRYLPNAYIANSLSTAATIKSGSKKSLRVIYPGINIPKSNRFDRPKGDTKIRLVMVGRISPWKGQHILLQALAAVPDHLLLEVVIVGGTLFGEHEYEAKLKDAALDVPRNVTVDFTGHSSDVFKYLCKADVLVHASVLPEPFGLVVVEGMAAGCAVIATTPGGPSEVITDGVDGVLVPTGDVLALTKAIIRLAMDGPFRDRISVAAAQTASRFAISTSSDEYEDFLSTVIEQHRN